MPQELVWELSTSKGKNKVYLRTTSSFTAEGRFTKVGKYTLHLLTKEDRNGPVAVRKINIKFSVVYNGEIDDPVEILKSIHCKRQEDRFSFEIMEGQEVTWNLVASSPVILKTITFSANITYTTVEEISDEKPIEEEQVKLKLSEKEQMKLDKCMRNWPPKADFNELTYPQDIAIKEMSRESNYKQRAMDLGLIRPFLLFVSMDPKTRLQWAKFLNIDIISKKYYGDAHQEAWKLLVRKQRGVQSRAGHAFTESAHPLKPNPVWYQILHRVCRKAAKKEHPKLRAEIKVNRKKFREALECSKEPSNTDVFRMEEIFSDLVRSVAEANYANDDSDFYSILKEKMLEDDIIYLCEKLYNIGYSDDHLVRYICALSVIRCNVVANSDGVTKWAKSKVETHKRKRAMIVVPMVAITAQVATGVTSPLTIIPALMLVRNTTAYVFRETPGRLLLPLIALMKQKEILAFQGIKIDDYYPVPEK